MPTIGMLKYMKIQVMLIHFLLYGFTIDIITARPFDADLSIKEIVERHGYLFESHEVTTEDGYILTLHRIPGKNFSSVWNFPKEYQDQLTGQIGSPLFL